MADAIEEAHRLANLHMTAKAHHREDANLALKPHLEQLRTAYELSAKLAEQAIKSGFILNGGALVLLSGFAAFFKLNPDDAAVVLGLLGAVGAFSSGLLFSCITCFCAYSHARREADVALHRVAGTTLIYLSPSEKKNASENPEIKSQYDAAARFDLKAKSSAKWAIVFGALSLVAFVAGVVIGGRTLISHAATSAPGQSLGRPGSLPGPN